jgi:hypothetical protein
MLPFVLLGAVVVAVLAAVGATLASRGRRRGGRIKRVTRRTRD